MQCSGYGSHRKGPAVIDKRAAFVLRVLMERRGLSSQGLASAMLVAGFQNAPSRTTIDRITREGAVPQRRHKAAIAQFFDRTTDSIWRVPGSERVAA